MNSATTSVDDEHDDRFLVALLSLPGIGPNWLSSLLEEHPAHRVWDDLTCGRPLTIDGVSDDQVAKWRSAARSISVDDHWSRVDELGIWVARHGSSRYPERLRHDVEPPHLIFGLGRALGDEPTVAIVGTRNCTSYGRRCAFEFGAALADAGVSVVSGLALGIDAAAHQGVLSVDEPHRAPPVGVVGSGLDIVYPRRNEKLWAHVAASGLLVSETAPGVGPQKWRFPARNRIIAGLADAVVVIESHEHGGSLSTVDAAQERDIPVGAVPGPITSNSSVGTNRLISEGAVPLLSVEDVLFMIGHSAPQAPLDSNDDIARSSVLLDALGWNPLLFEELCSRVTLSPSEVAVEVERLVVDGLCAHSGPWIERVR